MAVATIIFLVFTMAMELDKNLVFISIGIRASRLVDVVLALVTQGRLRKAIGCQRTVLTNGPIIAPRTMVVVQPLRLTMHYISMV